MDKFLKGLDKGIMFLLASPALVYFAVCTLWRNRKDLEGLQRRLDKLLKMLTDLSDEHKK